MRKVYSAKEIKKLVTLWDRSKDLMYESIFVHKITDRQIRMLCNIESILQHSDLVDWDDGYKYTLNTKYTIKLIEEAEEFMKITSLNP